MAAASATSSLSIADKVRDFPPLTATEENLGKNWWSWKTRFLAFLRAEDPTELYKDQWMNMFLTMIGPFGQRVYKDLSSRNAQRTKDLKVLLSDLDLYFIFGAKQKQRNEDIDHYIDNLMLMAITSNHGDPASIVKEKIIRDIASRNYPGRPAQLRDANLVLYLQLLDLHKVKLFWRHCEAQPRGGIPTAGSSAQQQQQQQQQQQLGDTKCIRCGTRHGRNMCPAYGTQCTNCQGYNHFAKNCKIKYVRDCTKCGLSHVQSRCTAYGELCTNCGRANHFSWLCHIPVVTDCSRCGTDHAVSACPAYGRVCSRCNKPNHLTEKCVS